jgi:hypothetical protein
MRKLLRVFLLLSAMAGAGWFAFMVVSAKANTKANGHTSALPLASLNQWLSPSAKVDETKMTLIKQARVSRAFVLTRRGENYKDGEKNPTSLQFPVQTDRGEVRLISSANISDIEAARKAHLANPGQRWDYQLVAEFLDSAGEILEQRQYHISANLMEMQRPDGSIGSGSFYLDSGLNPLSGEINIINLQGLSDKISGLRVKLVQADAAIVDVSLRVFQPKLNSQQETAHQWQRLSSQQRQDLARAAVLDPALLQTHEKQNLLRNANQAIGPLGVEGRDYLVRDLYILFENQGAPQAAPIASVGSVFDQQNFATIPIPASGGKIRLDISASPRPEGSVSSVGREIKLRWYGSGVFQRSSSSIVWQGVALQHSLKLQGGLLELEGPRELIARAFLENDEANQPDQVNQAKEITPVAQHERAFFASQSQPVEYAISASAELSGLRLTVRSLMPGQLTPTKAHYTAFDAAGKQLGQGLLPIPAKAAHYERVMADYSANGNDPKLANILSEPVHGFFVLPANTARFSVRAEPGNGQGKNEGSILVVAHTRPWALAREQRIPDDSYAYDAQGKRIPAWFLLRPQNEESMISNDRSRLLSLQSRPLEMTQEQGKILSGAAQWQDYRPRGNWLARPIYTPRDVEVPYREEVLPTMFSPVGLGQTKSIEIPPYQGTTVVQPTLVWLGPNKATELEISLDGKPFYSIAAHGPYGQYQLPAIAAGRHTVEVKSNVPGQVLINHMRPGSDALMRRIGQRINGELVFDFDRTSASAETLTARLYQQAGQAQDGKVSIRIEGPPLPTLKPLSGWVFADRVATVRPAADTGRVFDTEGQLSDGGNPIFLPFPADAPVGRYRITLKTTKPAYVSLSRLSANLVPQRKLHHQTEIQHVQIIE